MQAGGAEINPAGSDGGEQVRTIDPAGLPGVTWRKSSWSAYNGNCVEVAELPGGMIGVRDSKDRDGGVLVVAGAEWRSFLARAKSGALAG